MVPSPKLSFIANGNHLTGVGLAPGSTIHFGSLEFTAEHLVRLSLSPQEWDLSTKQVTVFEHHPQGLLR
jgi:hypothetical protein